MIRLLYTFIFASLVASSRAGETTTELTRTQIVHTFSPVKELKNEKKISLLWTWQIHNPTDKVKKDIVFKGFLPMLKAPGQRLTQVKFSRAAAIRTDELGHALAELHLDAIAPYDSVRLDIQAEVCLHPELPAPVWSSENALMPSPFVESSFPEIMALASTLKTPEAASLWVGKNIRSLTPYAETLGASRCLDKKEGDCTERACLMTALCRAQKHPALPVFGFIVARSGQLSAFTAHDCLYLARDKVWQRQEPGAKEGALPPFIAFRLIGSSASTLLGGEVRHRCSDPDLEITMNPK